MFLAASGIAGPERIRETCQLSKKKSNPPRHNLYAILSHIFKFPADFDAPISTFIKFSSRS